MSRFVVDELPDSCGACPCFSSKDGGCPFGENFGSCFDRFVILTDYLNHGCHISQVGAESLEPVKRGKWVLRNTNSRSWECSQCGLPDDNLKVIRSRFCSYCGAKMDGEVEQE